jgi:hypothetical protein
MKTLRCLQGSLIFAIAVGCSLTAGAAVLKSNGVQTGVVTMPGGSTAATVAITSVNTNNTFVICNPLISKNGNGAVASEFVTCELTGPTTLTITNGAADSTEVVRWYVVEFSSGVTVQRGLVPTATYLAGTATVNVAIAAVNLATTFVLISARTAYGGADADEQFTPTAQLTTTTNLQLTRSETGTALAVAWQVIQINSAAVQSGTASIAKNTTSITATLGPAVDTTKTFLVFTGNASTKAVGVESKYLTTGEITNATTLTFTRAVAANGAGGQVDIAWFAVSMTDRTAVQSNTNTTPNPGTTTMNATLGTPVVINRSVPFISVSGDPASLANNDLEDNSWAAVLTSTTNLQMTKSTTALNQANTTIAWQVVQFANDPQLIEGDGREIFP